MLSAWRLPSVQSSGSRVCRSPCLRHGGLGRCSRRTPEQRLGTGSTQAQLLLGLWDLPGPGVEPVSPALAGGFFTPWATREAQQGCCFFFFFSFLQSGLPTLEKDCLLYSPCKPFLSSQSVSVSPALSTPPPHRRGPRSGLGAGRKDGALY